MGLNISSTTGFGWRRWVVDFQVKFKFKWEINCEKSRYQTSPASQAKRKARENDSRGWPLFTTKQFWNAWKGWSLTRISKPKTIHLSASLKKWFFFALLALTTWTCVSPQITIIVMSPLYLLFFFSYYVMDKKPLKPPRPPGDDKHGIEYTALKSEFADTAKGEALSIVVLFVQVKKKRKKSSICNAISTRC